MNLDLDEIRKPLGAFAKQSESQRYIKNIRNLGDAWRRLSDKPVADCDKDSIVIETNFGLTMKISPTGVEISINPVTESTEMKTEQGLPVSTDKMKMQEDSTPTEADTTMEEPTQEPSASTSTKKAQRPKQYRIFADFCTDFLWREPDDIADDSDDEYMIESQELLDSPSFPPSLLGLYDAWVETYNENFDRRLNKPGDFQASVFPTRSESVAWDVAGYLLAWRITMAPEIDRIELSAGSRKWIVRKDSGEETKLTREFFEDLNKILKNGPLD